MLEKLRHKYVYIHISHIYAYYMFKYIDTRLSYVQYFVYCSILNDHCNRLYRDGQDLLVVGYGIGLLCFFLVVFLNILACNVKKAKNYWGKTKPKA